MTDKPIYLINNICVQIAIILLVIVSHFCLIKDETWLQRTGGAISIMSICFGFIRLFSKEWEIEVRRKHTPIKGYYRNKPFSEDNHKKEIEDITNSINKEKREYITLIFIGVFGGILNTYGDLLYNFFQNCTHK